MTGPGTVLITGSTGGFGRAFTRKFAENGWTLILQARSRDKLDALLSSLPAGVPVHTILADMTEREALAAQLDALSGKFSNIDVLINNAGLALGLEPAYACDINDWDMMIDVNAKALAFMTYTVVKKMRRQHRGHIVNIGSAAGNYPYPGGNVYCASKAFVKQFSLALRADLQGTNIRVSNIEPGMAETDFSKIRFKGDTEKASTVYRGTKPLQAEDIAEAVYWTVTCPPHMNINRMEIMPTAQSFGPHPVERQK